MSGRKKFRTLVLIVCCCLTASLVVAQSEDVLATYAVRWVHGGVTEYGKLEITSSSLIFQGDGGQKTYLPYLYLDMVKLVNTRWIQARSNRESGMSFGLNDVYNFGVVGGLPDKELLDRVNRLIFESKKTRVDQAQRLEGEISRYMVKKMETVGDDVGLLIILQDKIIYRSDTKRKDHDWPYEILSGVEILRSDNLKIHTQERSIMKMGAHRVYEFFSQTGPIRHEDISFIMKRIIETR